MSVGAGENNVHWTVMAYMAGDNSLAEDMVLQLQEMRSADLEGHVRIIAQLDPSALGIPTQRFLITSESLRNGPVPVDDLRVTGPDTPLDETNTGSTDALSGFVGWARHSPKETGALEEPDPDGYADKYALILSGHGSGATEDFLLKDEAAADSLTIPELREALERARILMDTDCEYCRWDPETDQLIQFDPKEQFRYRISVIRAATGKSKPPKIDLLGMDACFMNMLEVCYEVRDSVKVMVGAEGFEPDFGWPYTSVLNTALKAWSDRGELSALPEEDLGKAIVRGYVEYYQDYDRSAGRSVDLAAIKLDQIDELVEVHLNGLGEALSAALADYGDQIVLAHWRAQTYKFDQFVDLRDFCKCLRLEFEKIKRPRSQAVRDVLDVCKTIDNGARWGKWVIVSRGCGADYQHSYGLSVYLPWAVIWPDYENLLVAGKVDKEGSQGAPKWIQFLKDYTKGTRRDRRNGLEDPLLVEQDKVVKDEKDWWEEEVRPLLEASLELTDMGVLDALKAFHRYAKSRYAKSRYAKSRYAKSRYAKSRYAKSKFEEGGSRDRTMKNVTPASGDFCWPPSEK